MWLAPGAPSASPGRRGHPAIGGGLATKTSYFADHYENGRVQGRRGRLDPGLRSLWG
jgi:hypothetical protein